MRRTGWEAEPAFGAMGRWREDEISVPLGLPPPLQPSPALPLLHPAQQSKRSVSLYSLNLVAFHCTLKRFAESEVRSALEAEFPSAFTRLGFAEPVVRCSERVKGL